MPLTLTVDVEDWAQSTLDPDLPITERARANTHHVLDLLAEAGQHATCFVLGKFAEKFPECVKRIQEEGHEVASHGYGHVDVFRQTPDAFREDLRRSKGMLEDLTGKPVLGYRAPAFSITRDALWAPPIIAEEGYRYDSSINPAVAVRNGIAGWPDTAVRLKFSGLEKTLVEYPMATFPLLGRQWPVAGGGYHRLLPGWMICAAASRLLRSHAHFVAYCHPYEFDPDEFKHTPFDVPRLVRVHQGLGRKGFEGKFKKLMGVESSRPLRELLDAMDIRSVDFDEIVNAEG